MTQTQTFIVSTTTSNSPNFGLKRVKTHRTAMLIANQLVRKNLGGYSRSEALSMAYRIIRELKAEGRVMYEICFRKKYDDKWTTRIVLTDWLRDHTVKGTGTPVGPERKLYTCVARRAADMKHDTISAYKNRTKYIIRAR